MITTQADLQLTAEPPPKPKHVPHKRQPKEPEPLTITCACGHLSCICESLKKHTSSCKFLAAVKCPIGIECPHGYDVCPLCDPCTCNERQH